MNASAKVTSSAPPEAAPSMILHVFSMDFRRSSHSGSYCATATRVVDLDMMESCCDNVDTGDQRVDHAGSIMPYKLGTL
jgi:hypothetical protein